jgi:mono/diheme cytochrome c family protein
MKLDSLKKIPASLGATLLLGVLATPAYSQTSADPTAPNEAALFQQGSEQYKRTCLQCHGRNMVNAGTTVYDLRRFPVDDRERFFNSVTNGKGNMPSFKDALTTEQITVLWTYVKNRGKAPE